LKFSIIVYRDDNRIVGYEIEYQDAKKVRSVIKRTAAHYKRIRRSKLHQLKLEYNEHLADIEVVYSYNDIKYIELGTSKGRVFKIGVHFENCFSSFSKIDVSQKAYTPIIAFAGTFSNDALKELFIYRCPVRISKRKKKRLYTVNEINNMKAAMPNDEEEKVHNPFNIIRDVTKKSVVQLRALKAFQSILEKKHAANATTSPVEKQEESKDDKKKAEVDQEEYDFGVESDEEEKNDEKKEKAKKDDSEKPKNSPNFFSRLFGKDSPKLSTQSSPSSAKRPSLLKEILMRDKDKDGKKSPITSPKSAALKKKTLSSMLKFGSMKRLFGDSPPNDKKENAEEKKQEESPGTKRRSIFGFLSGSKQSEPNNPNPSTRRKSIFSPSKKGKNYFDNEEKHNSPRRSESPSPDSISPIDTTPIGQETKPPPTKIEIRPPIESSGRFTAAFNKYQAQATSKIFKEDLADSPLGRSRARSNPNQVAPKIKLQAVGKNSYGHLLVPTPIQNYDDDLYHSPELKPKKQSPSKKSALMIPKKKDSNSSSEDESDLDRIIHMKKKETIADANRGFNLLSILKEAKKNAKENQT